MPFIDSIYTALMLQAWWSRLSTCCCSELWRLLNYDPILSQQDQLSLNLPVPPYDAQIEHEYNRGMNFTRKKWSSWHDASWHAAYFEAWGRIKGIIQNSTTSQTQNSPEASLYPSEVKQIIGLCANFHVHYLDFDVHDYEQQKRWWLIWILKQYHHRWANWRHWTS